MERDTVATAPKLTFEARVLGVSGSVRDRARGGPMSRGDRAELRRMREGVQIPPDQFWALVAKYDISKYEEAFWRVVVPLMVGYPHQAGLSAGRALAKAGVSRSRVERWLRYDAERARIEAKRLLSKVDDGFDWLRFARLLWHWDEQNKLSFARDYYLAPESRKQDSAAQKGD